MIYICGFLLKRRTFGTGLASKMPLKKGVEFAVQGDTLIFVDHEARVDVVVLVRVVDATTGITRLAYINQIHVSSPVLQRG